MRTETKEVAVYIKKGLIFSIRTSYKSACGHPFVVGALLFLLLLYRLLPSLFHFLVSSSPVIVCTMLLLGALLSFGQPNIPEIEEEEKKTHNISALQVEGIANDLVVKKDEGFSLESLVDSREIVEKAIEESDLSEPKDILSGHLEREVLSSSARDEGEEIHESIIGAGSAAEEAEKEFHWERVVDETEDCDHKCFEKAEFSEERLLEDPSDLQYHLDVVSAFSQKEIKGLNMGTDERAVESCFALDSSWKSINGHDGISDSGSDRAESSSPDASMADIIPMLDELHPLLDSGSPQPAQKPGADSDASSKESSMDQESDDASAESSDEEDEQQKEEVEEEKDDRAEVLVQWTADDEKNLMDLGTSEVERNQRLENMIAKRRARKNQRIVYEKNLIDLDSANSVPISEELSYLQLPLVSMTRQNPFDLPCDTEASMGLPPIPGSAPSVLLPMKNPFDTPYDWIDESSRLTEETLAHRDFVLVQPKEIIFRRHETFAFGSSFPEDQKEKSDIQLRPLFGMEQTHVEVMRYAQSHGRLSENNNLNMHSVLESESVSSVGDQTCPRELVGQELHLESISDAAPNHDAKTVSNQANEADLVEIERQQTNFKPGCGLGIAFSASEDNGKETSGDATILETVQEDMRHATELNLPISDDVNSEVVEQKHKRSGCSSSSEVNEKIVGTTTDEGSINLEDTRGDPTSPSSDFVQSVLVDSNLLSVSGEAADASQAAEPVYDTSPSAVEKSIPDVTSHNDDLIYPSTGSFKSTSSLSSDMLVQVSEMGSPSRPIEKNLLSGSDESASFSGSTGDELETGSGVHSMVPSNSFSVAEKELSPEEVNEIREHDVVQVGTYDVHGFIDPLKPAIPESSVDQIMQDSSSNNTDSSDTGTMDVQGRLQSEGSVMIDAAPPYSGGRGLVISAAEQDQPSSEKSIVSPFSDASFEEFRVSILPPIPEEILEETSTPIANVGVADFHKIEEHNFSSFDVEQELSFFHGQSTEKNDDNVNLLDFELPTSSSDLKDEILFEQIEQEEEKPDEVQDLVEEIKGLDAGLLSELDVVGDFHSKELRSDESLIEETHQSDIGMRNDGADSMIYLEAEERLPQLQVPKTKQVEDTYLPGKQHSEEGFEYAGALPSALDQPEVMESEVGTSNSGLSAEDTESVGISEFHVPEMRSVDDNDSTFMKLQKEGIEEPISMELTANRPVLIATPDGSAELVLEDDLTKADLEMTDFDVKHLEAIEPAFKMHEEVSVENKEVLEESEVGSSELRLNETDTMILEVNSGLQEVKASSLDDIHLALKKVSEDTEMGSHLEKSVSLASSVAEPPVIESVAGPSELLLEGNSDLQDVEARSLVDIHLALKKLSEGNINKPDLMKPEVGSSEVVDTGDLEKSASLVSLDAEPFVIESEAEPSELLLEVNSDVEEAKERSFEDTNLKPVSEGTTNNMPVLMEPRVIHSKVGETEKLETSASLASSNAKPVVIESQGAPSEFLSEVNSDLQVVDTRSLEDIHLALEPLSEGTTNNTPVLKQEVGPSKVQQTERHLETSAVSSDAEPLIIESEAVPSEFIQDKNSDLQEVEARPVEDIHLALEQLSEGTNNNASVLKQEVGPSEVGETERSLEISASLVSSDIEPVIIESEAVPSESTPDVNSDLQEVEARSVKDNHLALEQVSEGTDNIMLLLMGTKVHSSEVGETESRLEKSDSLASSDAEPLVIESSEIFLDKTDVMPIKIRSDLHEVEASSLEDLQVALKHPSEGNIHNSPEKMEPNDGSSEVGATERHLQPDALEVTTAEVNELVHKEAEVREGSASECSKRSDDGVEEVASASASASAESKKKDKFKRSGFSTSSSSSSSDSD